MQEYKIHRCISKCCRLLCWFQTRCRSKSTEQRVWPSYLKSWSETKFVCSRFWPTCWKMRCVTVGLLQFTFLPHLIKRNRSLLCKSQIVAREWRESNSINWKGFCQHLVVVKVIPRRPAILKMTQWMKTMVARSLFARGLSLFVVANSKLPLKAQSWVRHSTSA